MRQRWRLRGIGGFLAAAGAFACCAAAGRRRRAADADPARTRADRASQHRPARDRFLALAFGVVLFAVVTAIMLVRTRSAPRAWRHGPATRSRACATNSTAPMRVILSEPQIVVDWPAGADEPTIEGDPAPLGVPRSHRVLAFGTWLDAGKASAMERAVDALRARGEAVLDDAHHAGRPSDRSARPRHRRPRRAAPEGRQRHQARAGRTGRPIRKAVGRGRVAARTHRNAAVPGLDARCRRTADLRQCRLCARRRSRRPRRRRRAPSGTSRQRARATPSRRREAAGGFFAAGCAPSSPAARRTFDVLDFTPSRQRRHRHRRHRSRDHARGARSPGRCASPHARSAPDRRRHVRCRPAADLLQRRLSRAVGPRCRLSRPGPDRLGGDRGVARGPQAAGGAGFPAMEGAASRSLSRGRAEGAYLAPCRAAAPCASSPRPIPTAASPICSTTSPSGSISSGASRN